MQSMELKKLLSYTRQAVDDYKLIEEGDHIAVGISGGKDSLTLLYALAGLRRFYPKKFTLTAITVDLGYDSFDRTYPVSRRQRVGQSSQGISVCAVRQNAQGSTQ